MPAEDRSPNATYGPHSYNAISMVHTRDQENGFPRFGHGMLAHFSFEDGFINLNSGSFGSLPRDVSKFCVKKSEEIEANPDKFHRIEVHAHLVVARKRISHLIGCQMDECVFVPNVMTGINTILRNFDWNAGDEIVKFSTTYFGVARALQYISDTQQGVKLSTCMLEFPMTHAAIIDQFKRHISDLKLRSGFKYRNPKMQYNLPKIVAVIDAVASTPGLYLPWKEMVEICHQEGVYSVVDAAHALGQEVRFNLYEIKPDFWVASCTKWLFAKRGSAVLYVPQRNQHLMRSALPTSWEYISPDDPSSRAQMAPNFVKQHGWPSDFIPYLSVVPALDFRLWLGGEERINTYCHALAYAGGKCLAKILGTRTMDESFGAEAILNMTNVELPLPSTESDEEIERITAFLQNRLIYRWNAYVLPFYHGRKWWVRCSAQIWNEISDFVYIGNALAELSRELQETTFNGSNGGLSRM